MESTAEGRRALKALTATRAARPDVPTVVVLREGARLASAIARTPAAGPLDVVRYAGHNPLLLPAVEGILADADPQGIWLGGRGERLVGAALGAGDFFLERAGDPRGLSERERARLVARAALVRTLVADAPALEAPRTIAASLRAMDVALVAGPYDAHAPGVLVYPVEG